MKKMLRFCASVIVAIAASGASVHADTIPWGYSAADTTIFNNNNPIMSSSIKFSGSSGVASGNSGIIIYNLTTTSGVPDTSPDSFSSVPFTLAVTLTDIKATGSASPGAVTGGVVNFAGLFNATNVTSKSLLPGVNTFTSPISGSVILGGEDVGWRNYTVTINSFTSPGQPGGAPGSIQAIVEITPTDGPGGSGETPPSATPEPTSLLLAGLGLPLVIFLRRRKKEVVE